MYASRREALIAALAERGLTAYGRSGLNVWVPVREEAQAVSTLLEAGWLVLAGERFRIHTPPGVRITISALPADEALGLQSSSRRSTMPAAPGGSTEDAGRYE